MKATFFERLAAYAIDIIIVSIIVSLLCSVLPDHSSNLNEKASELANQYATNEITTEVFIDEYKTLLYKNGKEEFPSAVVNLVITFAYFVVFQYMNSGRSVGKKLFGLQVVGYEDEKPISIMKGFLRSLIILGIASGIVNLIGIKLLSKNGYFTVSTTIGTIESIFIIVSIILMIGKNGRGLHDIMMGTKVIKEGRG